MKQVTAMRTSDDDMGEVWSEIAKAATWHPEGELAGLRWAIELLATLNLIDSELYEARTQSRGSNVSLDASLLLDAFSEKRASEKAEGPGAGEGDGFVDGGMLA